MDPTLILHDLPRLHWAPAGALIALTALALLWFGNIRLGISTGLENLCSLASSRPYFQRAALHGPGRWRLPFLVGLVAGGAMSALLGGGWEPMWDLGRFDAAFGWGPAGKVGWMFAGGLLIGAGTRLGGGCTSGHGIMGMSNLEPAGIIASLSYMASGVAATWLVYGLVLGGG